MKGKELNDNDNKLLAYCFNRRRHLSDIASNIGIDVKNVSTRIERLENMELIEVTRIGNKKFIRTIAGDKTKEYILEILRQLKLRGGDIKQENFLSLLPYDLHDLHDRDKYSAPLNLMFIHPHLIERHIKITDEGLRFLEEHSK